MWASFLHATVCACVCHGLPLKLCATAAPQLPRLTLVHAVCSEQLSRIHPSLPPFAPTPLPRAVVSLIEMSDAPDVRLERVPLDAALGDTLLRLASGTARSHGNYLPTLRALQDLLRPDRDEPVRCEMGAGKGCLGVVGVVACGSCGGDWRLGADMSCLFVLVWLSPSVKGLGARVLGCLSFDAGPM